MKRLWWVLLLLPVLSGCSLEKIAADNMVPVFVKTKNDFNRETVVAYAREAGPALLATLNGFVLASPENAEFRLLQAEMNATFAFGFLEQEDPDWATAHYEKAQAAALVALADEDDDLAEELPKLSGEALAARLEELDEDAAPALFWWGFARGAQINLHRSDPQLILDLDKVDVIMAWLVKTDETYFNGGPHLFLAIRHTMLPETLGGKPEVGLEHFRAVERITKGKLLIAKVLQAQFHAPSLAATPAGADLKAIKAAQDAAWKAFYDPLAATAEAPADLWPDNALQNAVAKQRALGLLKDPESAGVIAPEGAKNAYQKADDAGGDWGDGEDAGSGDGGDDWGGDGDWGDG